MPVPKVTVTLGTGISVLLAFVLSTSSVSAEDMIKIVALGDSTTAGTPGFRSPVEAPPRGKGNPESQYTYWMMKRHPEWQVLNRGVNGERSDQILARFKTDVLVNHPQFIIVLAGVNDLYQGRSAGEVKRNLQTIYESAADAGIRVIACTVLPYDRSIQNVQKEMAEVNDWIRSYAGEHDFGFCDTHGALEDPAHPHHLTRSPDGLHPDVNGYHKMGDLITQVLESEIGEITR